jgi:acyl-CoA synthetase (AMP-forming)/AMP-acid ligase II/acyl carrier protein
MTAYDRDAALRPPRFGTTSQTLAELLLQRERDDAGATAYEFLDTRGSVTSLTYGELGERARRLAGALEDVCDGAHAPAVVLHPPGLGFVVALWSCLLAGVPAVPGYPPRALSGDGPDARLGRLITDSQGRALLAPDEYGAFSRAHGLTLVTEAAASRGACDTVPALDDVAVIQYTSGTTGEPRGTVLTHRNLVHNLAAISELFALDSSDRGFSWLPPYHDMGLIGGLLTPPYAGFPVRLMSPLHFLKSPGTWLVQMSETGATVSGGPNFAYELVLRRFRAAAAGIELSRWRVAFNGAEPIRQATLAAFGERFAGAGFRADAFLPCYGLAEATLLVTGRHWAPGAAAGRTSCGPPVAGTEVVIADPVTGERLPDGAEGEICVRGPSISAGYWRGPGEPLDRESLRAVDGLDSLRTGDLGWLEGGELVVSGRSKDILISRGVNYHAADVEAAATEHDSLLRPIAAAFSVERPDDEASLVLVVERSRPQSDAAAAAARIRTCVLAALGLRLDVVAVVPPRTVPRTTSGKVRRSACRERFEAGEYAEWVAMAPASEPAARPDPGVRQGLIEELAGFLSGVFSVVCEVPDCDLDADLVALGGDSLRAAEIAAIVEEATACVVSAEVVLAASTPRGLAEHLVADWEQEGADAAGAIDRLRSAMREEAIP